MHKTSLLWVLLMLAVLELPGRLLLTSISADRLRQVSVAGVFPESLRSQLFHDFVDPKTRIQYDYDMFLGWRARPNQQGRTYRINTDGRRDDVERAGLATGRVFLTGGSAAWSWGAPSNDVTLPAELNRAVNARMPAGTRIDVLNLAEQAYGIRQEVARVIEAIHLMPRVVVFYDGANDLHSVYMGRDPRRYRTWGNFPDILRSSLREATGSSWVLTSDEIVHGSPTLRVSQMAWHALGGGTGVGAAAERRLTQAEEQTIRAFYRDEIPRTHRLLKGLGIRTLFVLQPIGYVGKPIHELEVTLRRGGAWWRDAFRVAEEEYRALNGTDGLTAVSLSGVFGREDRPVYLDPVHMNDLGNRLVGEALASPVVELLASESRP